MGKTSPERGGSVNKEIGLRINSGSANACPCLVWLGQLRRVRTAEADSGVKSRAILPAIFLALMSALLTRSSFTIHFWPLLSGKM